MGRVRSGIETLHAIISSPSTRYRTLGLGFYQAWMHITFLSPAVAGSNPEFVEPVRLAWLLSMVGAIATLFAAHRLTKTGALPLGPLGIRALGAATASLGTIVIGLSGALESVTYASFGALVTGVGAAGLVLACGESYNDTSRTDATFSIGMAYALSFVVYLPITFAGSDLAIALAAALPLFSALTVGPLSAPAEATTQQHAAPQPQVDSSGRSIIPRFAQTMFVFGAALGLMWSLTVHDTLASFGLASRLAFLGAGAVGVVIALWSLVRAQQIELRFIFAPVLPLIVAGFLLLPIVGPQNILIANTAVAVGFMAFEMLTWVALSAIVKRTHRTPTRVFSRGKAISYGGVVAGGAAGSAFALVSPVFENAILMYSFGAVMVLITVAVFVLGSKESFSQAFGVEPMTPSALTITTEALRESHLAIAANHKLTARETDVFLLLAQGRSLPYIESELYISHGTANTHVRSIYRKLDVHTRQELLDLLDRERGR